MSYKLEKQRLLQTHLYFLCQMVQKETENGSKGDAKMRNANGDTNRNANRDASIASLQKKTVENKQQKPP